jgi:hypothetical protein
MSIARRAGEFLLLHQAADLVRRGQPSTMTAEKLTCQRIATERAAKQRQRFVLRHAQPSCASKATTPSTLGKSASGLSPVTVLREDIRAGDMRSAHRGEVMPLHTLGTADAVKRRRQIEIRHRLYVDANAILGEVTRTQFWV